MKSRLLPYGVPYIFFEAANSMNLHSFPVRLQRFAPLLLVIFSAAAAVAAYLQALDYPFVYDDISYITENTKLAGLQLTELWRLFFEPYNTYAEFLPLRELSYWFDIALFGLTPSAFRAHNIILYLLCLPLAYSTTLELWRYFRPADAASAPWAAAAVTALFALHPAMVEAVVWVSGRKYVLPNLLSMLALWFAVRARMKYGLSALHAAATLIAFAAGVLSMISYITVAPVIAMLWLAFWLDIPKQERRRSMLLWPLAILLLAGLLFLLYMDRSIRSTAATPFYFAIEAVTRTLVVQGWLARLAISPESRHIFYPVFEDTYFPVMVALGAAVLVAAMAGMVMMLRKRSLESFSLAIFFLLCTPYIQLLPRALPSLAQDRYLALAAWPTILLVVSLSWRLKPLPRTALLFAIALPWGFQTIERPRDWRSFEALIDNELRATPGYYVPAWYKIFAVQLPQELIREAMETANSITAAEFRNTMTTLIKAHVAVTGAETTGNPHEAMTLLWKLGADLKQMPAQAKWNPTMVNFWGQNWDVTLNEWKYLTEHFPDEVAAERYNAGLSLLNNHDYKGAVAYLRVATESQHLDGFMRGTALKNLGLALIGNGQISEAEAPLRAALEQAQPDLQAHCLLAKVYKQVGRIEEEARAKTNCPGGASNHETSR